MALLTVSSARCRRDEAAEVFQGEPGDVHPLFDGELAERFEEECFSGPGRSAEDEVLFAVQPFQGSQRLLRRRWDGGRVEFPGVERFAGGERRPGPAGGQGGPVPPGDLRGEQGPQHFYWFPPLRPGGGQHLWCGGAGMRHPQPPQQLLEVIG